MKSLRTLASIAVALFACSAASAAAFMKVEGIPGESQKKNRAGWIELSSLAGLPSPREAAAAKSSGRRQHEPIIVRKPVDKASPLLADAMAKKRTLAKVEISHLGYMYTLTEVIITSVRQEEKQREEVITFNYDKIVWSAVDPNSQKSSGESPRKGAKQDR